MSTLSADLRRKLERAARDARNVATIGAQKSLEALAVHEPDPYRHMDEAQRTHRRKLRAQAKQLGDGESQTRRGAYEIKHLVEKLAYDQWHRLLFARFLLENNLLISPEHGVAVSLDDCEELAPSLGLKDAWAVAARFAAVELPEIFRADDPAGGVELPVEDRKGLIQLVTGLPVEVFTASDSLGWCYQFWQAERKDQVNAAGNKIGADELPSVTQLFTEDYMVDFLLDNTLGAWHAGKVLAANPKLAENAESEDELRQAVALPGCPWKYLRFIKGQDGRWTPAAGTFDGWPKSAAALRALDPCMGSGHFVVAMFERLVALRLAEEKLDAAAAVAAVIRDNLFGLEIDPRCTQIGAFNLALAAWRRVGHCQLPAMNLACSGLAPNTREADWLAIVDAASSRTPKEKTERLEASATFAPINYFRPDEPVANLTGNLPHWRQEGTTYFVTFRCADALPQEKLQQWQQELAQWNAAHPEPHDDATRHEFYERFPQRIQTWLDSGYGECVLREPAMREIVESALRHFDGQRYRLAEFVVAANHVHALVTPLGENLLSDILHSWKSFTSNQINKARGKSGTFWQKESFDHIVRSPASLAKFREYILSHNKVAAASVAAASSRTQPEGERLEAAATMRLQRGMERLYRLFQKAAVLGSLINPRAGEGDLLVAAFHELQPLLEKALAQETKDDTAHEMAVTARGLAKAAEILAGQFTLVATNVPYLGFQKQDEVLCDYCARVHPDAKADLATCFVERCLQFCGIGGSTALVTPQNWLFLNRFRHLRKHLLENQRWHVVARLGEHGFNSPQAAGAFAAMVVLSHASPSGKETLAGLDVADQKGPDDKAAALLTIIPIAALQSESLHRPDSTLSFESRSSLPLLSEYADSLTGAHTLDIERFRIYFWELEHVTKKWNLHASTPVAGKHYSGMEYVSFTREAGEAFANLAAAMKEEGFLGGWLSGNKAWGKPGVACSWMRQLPASLYLGTVYDNSAAAIIPHKRELIPAIWCFCSSPEYTAEVRKINQKVQVANSTLVKVPFDLAHWQKVAAEKYPHGLPKPFSSDPTQWLFNGHPAGADQPLHVAVARLLGYQWPRQTGSSFPDCPALGPDGLEKLADDDGVACLSATKGEAPAAERLRSLLVHALGNFDLSALIASAGPKGSKSERLEDWLRDEFFEQHCALFHHRPFIWHVWDGLKNGFSALVNYHKLTHANLEKLTFAYLGDWIRRQQAAVAAEEAGSDAKLQAAKQLQATLKLILEGEPPYDIFVRWKGLAQQSIGWHPDLNDGVRMNIRPFMLAPDGGKKGAGILRAKPNIKWEKDRGKEPQRLKKDFPWFWNGSECTGDRVNDVHLTREKKEGAKK